MPPHHFRRRTRNATALLGALTLAGVALSGCSLDELTNPVPSARPVRDVTIPSDVIAGGLSPEGGSATLAIPASTRNVVARVRVAGVTVHEPSGCGGGLAGFISPAGLNNPYNPPGSFVAPLSVRVTPDTLVNGWFRQGTSDEFIAYAALPVGTSAMSFTRAPLGREGCSTEYSLAHPDGPYDHTVTGSGTLVVDFVALDVTASTLAPTAGSIVHFTATPMNTQATAPVAATWEYVPLLGDAIPVSACYGQLTCDFVPPSPGSMRVQVRTVDGPYLGGFSDAIEPVNCPTPDSLLNNPTFRRVLQDGLEAAGQFNRAQDKFLTVDSARREVGGYALLTKATGTLTFRSMPRDPATNSPCAIDMYLPPIASTDSLIAIWHTHPFKPGGTLSSSERLPLNCNRGPNVAYDPAPSDDDWRTARTKAVKHYAIDARYVHVADGSDPASADSTKWNKLKKRYDWNTNSCKW